MNVIYESDELCHYGVLGMKWGVRKANKLYKSERKAIKKQYKADIKGATDKVDKKSLKTARKQALREHAYGGRTKGQYMFDTWVVGDAKEVRALMQQGKTHKAAAMATFGDHALTYGIFTTAANVGKAVTRKKLGI